MNALHSLTAHWQGSRTKLSHLGAMLIALAGFVGALPCDRSIAAAAACLALGGFFQRLATATATTKIGDLARLVTELADSLAPPTPSPPAASSAATLVADPLDGLPHEDDQRATLLPFPDAEARDRMAIGMAAARKKAGLLVLALWCLSQSCHAVPPRAVIQGNEAGISGEILILDATLSEGRPTHYRWSVEPTLAGRRQLVSADGGDLDAQASSKIQVATIPGRYHVRLIVSNADGNSEASRLVVIPGAVPPSPPPPPVPAPEPDPAPPMPPGPGPPPAPVPLPAGRFGLAQATFDLAAAVASPTRAAEALALADGARGLVASIRAGAKSKPQEIVNAMADVLDAATTAAWDAARAKLTEKIAALYRAGQLKTPTDWADLIAEMETGLRQVK